MNDIGARGSGKPAEGNRRLNIVLALAIALVALGSFAAVRWAGLASDVSHARVVVKDADGAEHEFSLSDDQTATIASSAGTNIIEIAEGRVRVSEADCPNQDCVHQGWIESSSQEIVCLPHRLTVDIVDDVSDSGIDVVGC